MTPENGSCVSSIFAESSLVVVVHSLSSLSDVCSTQLKPTWIMVIGTKQVDQSSY